MGMIGTILSVVKEALNDVVRNTVKADIGGGDNRSFTAFSASGDDSPPLPGDYVASIPTRKRGNAAAVGYLDPKNGPQAQNGEKRIYGRDADGNIVNTVWLLREGTIEVRNSGASLTLSPDGSIAIGGAGSIEIGADGSVSINGLTIDSSGSVSTTGSVSAFGVTDTTTNVTLSTHIHPTPAGPSSPATPGS